MTSSNDRLAGLADQICGRIFQAVKCPKGYDLRLPDHYQQRRHNDEIAYEFNVVLMYPPVMDAKYPYRCYQQMGALTISETLITFHSFVKHSVKMANPESFRDMAYILTCQIENYVSTLPPKERFKERLERECSEK